MMKKTDLNFDFMAHKERCQEEIYEAIHTLSYQEQIRYYQERVAQSDLGQWLLSQRTIAPSDRDRDSN